jgi:hypothetical protein
MTTLYDQWGLPVEHEIERAVRRMVESQPSRQTGDKMTTYLKITTDGECTLVEADSLVPLQEHIGGDIRLVQLNGAAAMYVDEDGHVKDLETNTVAMLILQHNGTRLLPGDRIVGTALLFGDADAEGNDQSIDPRTVEWLRRSQLTTFPDD